MWLATNTGVSMLNSSGIWAHFDGSNGISGATPNTSINYITEDMYGNMWFAHNNNGINILNVDGTWTYYDNLNGLSHNSVKVVEAFTFNKRVPAVLPLGELSTKVKVPEFGKTYNLQISSFNDYSKSSGSPTGGGIAVTPLRAPVNLEIATSSNGTVTLSWENHPENIGVSDYKVYDVSENMWIGTYAGVQKLINEDWAQIGGASLSGKEIYTMIRTSTGEIWAGTQSHGIFRSSDNGVNWINYTKDNVTNLYNNMIFSIKEDDEGNIWIGTHQYANKYDPNTNTWSYFSMVNTNQGLGSDMIYDIFIDSNQNKWFGTSGGGVSKYDGTIWTKYNSANSGLLNDHIRAISEDSLGNMWFGSSVGVHKFDGTTWTYFETPANVTELILDSSNNIWVGTWGNAIYRYDGFLFENITVANGIANPYIQVLKENVDGTIWIGTENGLTIYEPLTAEFNSYYTSSGLVDVRVSAFAPYVSSDELITVDGQTQTASFLVQNPTHIHKFSVVAHNSFAQSLFSDYAEIIPITFTGIRGKIYYDFDGSEDYTTATFDELLSGVEVSLYLGSEPEIAVFQSSVISNEFGEYSFDSLSTGTYYLEVNPKVLDASGSPDPSIKNNLYTTKKKEKTEVIFNPSISAEEIIDVGLFSLNVDRKGTWGDNLSINLSDLSKLMSASYWEQSSLNSGFNYIDLNYDQTIDIYDLSKVVNSNYWQFPDVLVIDRSCPEGLVWLDGECVEVYMLYTGLTSGGDCGYDENGNFESNWCTNSGGDTCSQLYDGMTTPMTLNLICENSVDPGLPSNWEYDVMSSQLVTMGMGVDLRHGISEDISEIVGLEIGDGDYLGAFYNDGGIEKSAGFVRLMNGEHQMLYIGSETETLWQSEGAIYGEPVYLKYYDASTEIEYSLKNLEWEDYGVQAIGPTLNQGSNSWNHSDWGFWGLKSAELDVSCAPDEVYVNGECVEVYMLYTGLTSGGDCGYDENGNFESNWCTNSGGDTCSQLYDGMTTPMTLNLICENSVDPGLPSNWEYDVMSSQLVTMGMGVDLRHGISEDISEIVGLEIGDGDYLGAFYNDGGIEKSAGFVRLMNGEHQMLYIGSETETLWQSEGAIYGEPVYLKYYDASTEIEYSLKNLEWEDYGVQAIGPTLNQGANSWNHSDWGFWGLKSAELES
jgi:hypothetical protein